MRALSIAMIFALGCGGTAKKETASSEGGADPQHAGPDGQRTDSVDPAAPVSPDECSRFTAHVIELYLAEMRRSRPAEEIPTDEQIAEVRAKLDAELTDKCVQFPRAVLECGLAAESFAAVAECQQAAPEASPR